MNYFIALIINLLLTFCFCVIFKKKFELTFIWSVFAIVIWNYIFGCFKLLYVGVWSLLGVVATSFIVLLVKVIKQKDKQCLHLFFTKLSIIFMSVAVVQFFLCVHMSLRSWDEFSHWGLVVKNMFYFKNFGNLEYSTTLFKGYPPAISLYLYFFEAFGSSFIDGYMYGAMSLFAVGLMLPIFDYVFNKKFAFNVFAFSVLMFLVFLFHQIAFSILMVDYVLGIFFAYLMFLYFKNKKIDRTFLIEFSVGGFVLVLLKNTGLFLFILSVVIIMVHCLICNRQQFKEFCYKKTNIALLFIPIIAIAIAKISWSLYLNINDCGVIWDTSRLTLKGLWDYLISPSKLQQQINANFWLCFVVGGKTNNYLFKLSPLTWLLILIALLILYYFLTKNKKEFWTLTLSFVSCVFIYLIGMLISYVFTFDKQEALDCASYARYVNSVALGMFLIVVAMILNQLKGKEYKQVFANLFFYISSFIFLMISAVVGITGLVMNIDYHNRIFETEFKEYIVFCKTLDYRKDSVYVIDVQKDGLEYMRHMICRYISTPADANGFKYGGSIEDVITSEYNDGFEDHTTIENVKSKLMNEYNYLYLHYVDSTVIERIGPLFDDINHIKNKSFFKCVIDGDNLILEPINL